MIMNNFLSKEDYDDFDQEKNIQIWLENNFQAGNGAFDFKYINRKGTARHSRVRASLSLDQKIREDSTGTFADIVGGCDGRDLYTGDSPDANHILNEYIKALIPEEEITRWLLQILKYWIVKNEKLFLTSPIDSESLRQFEDCNNSWLRLPAIKSLRRL